MPLSVNVSTGLVKGRFGSGVVAGPNGEKLLVPARGRIDFEPVAPYVPYPTGTPSAFTILRRVTTGILDSEGYLCAPHPDYPEVPGVRGLELYSPDDPQAGVQGWTWKGTPRFVNADGTRLHNAMEPFTFDLPYGEEVDLVNVVDMPQSPGIGKEQAIILAASAQAAATSAAGSAEAAAEAARKVVGALPSKADLIDGKVPVDQLPPAVGVTDEVVAPLVDMPETAAKIDARVAEQVAGKLDADAAEATFQTKTDAEQTAEALTAAVAEVATQVETSIAEKLGDTSSLVRGVISDTEPANPTVGMLWFDTSGASLAAPMGLTASATPGVGVTLNWSVPESAASPISAYRVYRDGTLISTTGPAATYVDSEATEGSYSYGVSAGGGDGRWSPISKPANVSFGIASLSGMAGRWVPSKLGLPDGSAVSTLASLGDGPAMRQAVAAKQPILKSGVVNGKDALRFLTANQHLMDATIGTTPMPVTVVSVVNVTGSPSIITSSGGAPSIYTIASGAEVRAHATSEVASAIEPWSLAAGWMILVQIADGANSKFYATKRTPKTWNAGTAATLPVNLRLGANSGSIHSTMDLAEVVLFKRALTDAEVQEVLSQLSAAYAINLGV